MSNDFRLKQNLKMSPNSQIKNLVPENLITIPPEDEWKLGRLWFNVTIGKLQGIFLKLDTITGKPLQPEELEVKIVGADALGTTKDGEFWPDGLFDFTQHTKIADAVDDMNEALKELSPPEATLLNGDLNLINQHFIVGNVSKQNELAPDTLRMNGITSGTTINYIIDNPNVSATLPIEGRVVKGKIQEQFGKADQGIIVAVINDEFVDEGINLFNAFNEASRDYDVIQGYDAPIMQNIIDIENHAITIEANPNKDNYISSSGMLTVNTITRYNNFKKWQKGTASVDFTVVPGRHKLHVEHDGFISGSYLNTEIITEPFKTNSLEVFYDPNNTSPTSTITHFDISSGITKYVSGIPYYNTNISFSFNYKSTELFNYTYWDKPVSIIMDGSNHNLMNWNDVSSSLSGLLVPMWNDEFNLVSYTLAYNSANTITNKITIVAKAGKPITGWGLESSITKKILIDTHQIIGNSSSIKETFIDEEYRIKIETIDQDDKENVALHSKGTWNSNLSLQLGEAQQFMGSLKKAQSDFVEYNIATDYTLLSGVNQEYYRRIYTVDEKPNSNGKIKLKTNGIIDTDFDAYIKLPGITGWLDLKELFDSDIFSREYNIDGTGCASIISKTTDGYEIGWSIGTFSTVNSGFGYLIKIIIKSNDCILTEISELSENWR